ncbi:sugar transferase [Lacipirellula limnantheis]|uniref:Undecaprenyl-phosphate N-acetylgalactosaminyl 1-phosphate transferase n=1 Tax=Lacipirellula limnantheis TaxID=2528024 RepID=A0A517TYA6_9BACT|nr:sugar transferase [Lacipirellula limnantheis]QDT73335.1 Putative undecaprenyl-phosphate N-acetylgalactosaminyl 1-phosphate transferase [Lacipirellula limnantheis]
MNNFIDLPAARRPIGTADPFGRPVTATPYFERKAPWMRLLGCLLLIFFTPLILVCGLLVRLTSRGPAIYRQTRLGKDGQPFEILKLRTMTCDAEAESGAVLCTKRDARVTPVGRVLRFLHLDELPQLVNVMRGEMCLVGPRPERPEIIAKHRLDEYVPGFCERMHVLPGVTGLAQINLSADVSADCVIPKVALDREYVATANAALDLRILACTALRMLGVRHGRAVRLFGVHRRVNMPDVSREIEITPASSPIASHQIRPVEAPREVAHAGATSDSWSARTEASAWNGADRPSPKAKPKSGPPRRPR